MHFTRLRVLGFKSFVEPTEFLIEPGLTGVVGPNGCGKSNLVEALRWVMGESSYKNMRASGMDDVIFSGSLNRPSRNTAEVSLLADNKDRSAPAAMNDSDSLEITRRIEREAGSVYKINGRDVRARDVQLLFADASTGAHSPAMVGQGRIGELIAAKPTDRRKLLEEAAGISGLHSRRHEAELRLRGAETNLERLDDVIGEIEVQLETLKRQARQAVRYRNLSGDIRRAEASVFHLRWIAAKTSLSESEAALSEASAATEERAREQGEAAKIQAEAAVVLPDLRDQAASAAAAVHRITLAQEALAQEEARVNDRLAALQRHMDDLAGDIAREKSMMEENATILARLDAEERDLEAANASTEERREKASARRKTAADALERSEAKLGEITRRQADIVARRSQVERTIADAERRVTRHEEEIARLNERIAALGPVSELEARLESLRADLETAAEAVTAREADAGSAEESLVQARGALDEARRNLSAAEQTVTRLDAERTALQRTLDTAARGDFPALLDSVSVDAGFEAALGAAFGDDLDASDDAQSPAHWRGASTDGLPSLPAGTEALSSHVRAPQLIAARLAQIGVVSAADGPALQSQLKPGQRLVSREGDLWRWDGYVTSAGAGGAAAQRLETRNRIDELNGELEEANAAASRQRGLTQEAENQLASGTDAEAKARQGLKDARRALETASEAMARAEREAGQAAAQRNAFEEALTRLTAELEEAGNARSAAANDLAETPSADALEGELGQIRETVTVDRSALAEASAEMENLGREAQLRSGRLAAIAVERKDWRERGANAEQQISVLTERSEQAAREKDDLSAKPVEIESQRRRLLSESGTADETRKLAADRLAEGEAILKEADTAAREALERLATAREGRGRSEERTVAARGRLEEVERQIGEALECEPHEAMGIAELKPDAPLPELEAMEARLERYKRERERLGAVNLRADAEAQEIGERRDALVSERDDLIAAIHRLRHGIGNLNREGRQRLLEAFETVNSHFQELFTHLFGGGQAELQLTESDDPLEAGLEILARPPGKKPQIMTLLSGGEQALTAMSLIFAVFRTNPAPICVLDEVDAPLDDANVVRFCDLLDEMTRKTDTRFVVITHNPITMARMNRLFGVTMAERGVSQMVSVDLETAESFREAS